MAKRGVNKVILVGNLGENPETRLFPDGGAVTNASIATSEQWKDKATGGDKERTEWHRVVFRDRGAFKMAQIAGEYLTKGSKVYIEGHLQTRKYEKDGQTHYITEIMADEMQFLDRRPDNAAASTQKQSSDSTGHAAAKAAAHAPNFDDDIPF